MNRGFKGIEYYTSKADLCVCTKWGDNGEFTITNTYTDDVFGASSSAAVTKEAKGEIERCYEVKDLGKINKLLGIQVVWNKTTGSISFSQENYIHSFLDDYKLQNITPYNTPEPVGQELTADMCPSNKSEVDEMKDKPYANLLGKAMYAQVGTRYDISNTIKNLSCFQKNPGILHWWALLHLLRYLKATAHYKLTYCPPPHRVTPEEWVKPIRFINADFAACKDTCKSTLGYAFMMSGSPVSWSSKRQATVALSTTEAEYIVLSRASQQLRWMYSWCKEIRFRQSELAILRGDNLGSVRLTKTTKDHHKVKYINIHHHYLCELCTEGKIKVQSIQGTDNPDDIFTKPLPRDTFKRHLESLNMTM